VDVKTTTAEVVVKPEAASQEAVDVAARDRALSSFNPSVTHSLQRFFAALKLENFTLEKNPESSPHCLQ